MRHLAYLALICVLCVLVRLFPVFRFEPVHRFSHYEVLLKGPASFRNLRALEKSFHVGLEETFADVDSSVWWPYGREGPADLSALGLLATAKPVYWITKVVMPFLNPRLLAVLWGPLCALATVVGCFLLGKEATLAADSRRALSGNSVGLVAAAVAAVIPGLAAHTALGQFTCESLSIPIAVFAMLFWLRAVNRSCPSHAFAAGLAGLVASLLWQGAALVTLAIPMHAAVLHVLGRGSRGLYLVFCTYFCVDAGYLLLVSRNDEVAALLGAGPSADRILALVVFVMLQLWFVGSLTDAPVMSACLGLAALLIGSDLVPEQLLVSTWDSLSRSVFAHGLQGHSPASWASFFIELHFAAIALPAGIFYCMMDITDVSLFFVVLGTLAVYLGATMVQFIGILAPVAAVISGIAIISVIQSHLEVIRESHSSAAATAAAGDGFMSEKAEKRRARGNDRHKRIPGDYPMAFVLLGLLGLLGFLFARHSTWAISEIHSAPSIVMSARVRDSGQQTRHFVDDFRHGLRYLRHNTSSDAKVLTTLEHGYMVNTLADRTGLVDDTLHNTSHAAEMARIFLMPEEQAIKHLRKLDVGYVMVVFGGVAGLEKDDMNSIDKMLHMQRNEDFARRFATKDGLLAVGEDATDAMRSSLLYKLSYYRFGTVVTEFGKPAGFCRVRRDEVATRGLFLNFFEEVFTSDHWLVRIYRVLPRPAIAWEITKSAEQIEAEQLFEREKNEEMQRRSSAAQENTHTNEDEYEEDTEDEETEAERRERERRERKERERVEREKREKREKKKKEEKAKSDSEKKEKKPQQQKQQQKQKSKK